MRRLRIPRLVDFQKVWKRKRRRETRKRQSLAAFPECVLRRSLSPPSRGAKKLSFAPPPDELLTGPYAPID